MSSSTSKKKVIVIGAGVSGLACARELLSRHYEVLVVEARGRPGGRLKGQEVATSGETSVSVDVGGALIHGIHQNPIYKIARDQMGVGTYRVEQDCLLLDSSGNAIDPETDSEVSQEFNQCLEETFQQCNNTTRDVSFGRVFGKTCRRRNNNDPQNLLFQWHQSNLELSCGTSFENLGLEWNDDEAYEYQGDHVALPTSWNSVVEGLAEPLTIVYNAPVHSIRIVQQQRRDDKTTTTTTSPNNNNLTPSRRSRRLQGEDAHERRSLRQTKGVRNNILSIDHASCLSYDDTNATYNTAKRKQRAPTKVEVTLSQNKVLEADAVVCTLPLGVLQIPPDAPGHVEFDPPFSHEKLQAIQNLGSGLLNKCVLTFPYVFWSWNSDFVGVVDDPPQLILNGARILPPNHNAVLIWMFGGNQANQVETKSDAQVVEECLAVLQKLLHAEIPKPLDYVVTRWGRDPFSRGAFCFIPPGVAAHDTLEKLCEPIFDFQGIPRICFAGEHTTPYHPSTIHGALNSGVREAYRLDLSLFPKQNQYMEFESNYLYKKTFVVKRRFENTPMVQQQRRSGGVKTRSARMLKNGQHHVATTSSPPPSRRSDRVNKGNQIIRDQQVDRSLIRSYEAFRDWNMVADTVLPIYGGSDKSIPQLRARFQHLKSKQQTTKTKVDLSMWQRDDDAVERRKSRRTALLDTT